MSLSFDVEATPAGVQVLGELDTLSGAAAAVSRRATDRCEWRGRSASTWPGCSYVDLDGVFAGQSGPVDAVGAYWC